MQSDARLISRRAAARSPFSVAGASPVLVQMWAGMSPVPVPMWHGHGPRSRFVRSRCGLAAVGAQLAELGPGLERVLCCGRRHARADPGQVDRTAVGLVVCTLRPSRNRGRPRAYSAGSAGVLFFSNLPRARARLADALPKEASWRCAAHLCSGCRMCEDRVRCCAASGAVTVAVSGPMARKRVITCLRVVAGP